MSRSNADHKWITDACLEATCVILQTPLQCQGVSRPGEPAHRASDVYLSYDTCIDLLV